jgi:SAM-dependent methyltransferase
MKTFLHVGCGGSRKEHTTPAFAREDWRELRFDIDAKAQPDILGTMTDMASVASASVDALYSAHNIEHLYPHEVPVALAEFHRVLKPDGFLVLTCPDLQSVSALVAEGKLIEPAYVSPAGPIAALDILFGLRSALAAAGADGRRLLQRGASAPSGGVRSVGRRQQIAARGAGHAPIGRVASAQLNALMPISAPFAGMKCKTVHFPSFLPVR